MVVDVVFKNEGAVGGAFVFYALCVFDQQGDAFEGARREASFHIILFSCLGFGEGFIEIAVGEAVDFAVQLMAAINQNFE